MKKILLFGAGKSATLLIDYLLKNANKENWHVTVVDADINVAQSKVGNQPGGTAVSFDINDTRDRNRFISDANIVISLLPPALHTIAAKSCIELNKNLLTASYIDDHIRGYEKEISQKQLLFLCEMGLDPGIDHMSAMRIFDAARSKGEKINSFKSHCGGLVAPESDDNPWHYKISWNPRNILLAGKSGAHYRQEGKEVKLSYEDLFSADRLVEIPGLGKLGWYPNRDSLDYAPLYGIEKAETIIRTTLRHPDFMQGWKNVVDLKLTDENPQYESEGKSLKDFFTEYLSGENIRATTSSLLSADPGKSNLTREQFLYIGMNDDETIINKGFCSASDVMQLALEKKLALKPKDKDMIVMLHEIETEIDGKSTGIRSSLIVKGEDSLRTAMAKTVGLPLGIAAKLILNETIKITGLHIPTSKEIYEPVLAELEENGIKFHEEINFLS